MTRCWKPLFNIALTAMALLVSGKAHASDWYVDVASGSDANSGSSPATAWKTITHAIATAVPVTGIETIHIAPGLYDQGSGETFPFLLHEGQQVIGQGPGQTRIDSNNYVFQIVAKSTTNPGGVSTATMISGLTIDALIGVSITGADLPCAPVLNDLVLQGGFHGVMMQFYFSGQAVGASVSPRLSRVRSSGNYAGLFISAPMSSGPALGVVRVDDCVFEGNSSYGIQAQLGVQPLALEVNRSLVRGNLQGGILVEASASGPTGPTLVLNDSVIAHNSGAGVATYASSSQISGCTIAHNGAGLNHWGGNLEIADSIVWGNFTDLHLWPTDIIHHCDFVTGMARSGPGNFHVDPMFIDGVNGDYRLRFGSPCVDSADPVGGTATDISGTSRRLDGNLDTVRAPDMGAFELQTLTISGTPSIGQQLGFGFLGAADMSSTLYVAPHGTFPPQSTPFGLLYLSPVLTSPSATVIVQPAPPYVLRRRIPNNPALIGTYYSFQALTDSVLAPAGRAYTNPITFVITP